MISGAADKSRAVAAGNVGRGKYVLRDTRLPGGTATLNTYRGVAPAYVRRARLKPGGVAAYNFP